MKCEEKLKMSRVTSSDASFCLINSPKPKDIHFIILYQNKDKHKIIIFEQLEPQYLDLLL